MSTHQKELRGYLFALAKDMVRSGVLRHMRGETLETVLRKEWVAVAKEMQIDLVAVGKEIGLHALGAASEALGTAFGKFLDGVFSRSR